MPVPGTTMRSFRPQVQGVNGVVVSSHPSASMAGLDVLRKGGNAIDAGVAVGLALNIVHADDCGFLGVAPTIMYLAGRKEVTTIDGLGVWPKAASIEYFQRKHKGQMPRGIPRALTPGAADAWFTALARYGTMTFGEVAATAIGLAGQGFPMYRYLSDRLRDAFDLYAEWPSNAEIFLPEGRAPAVGEMFYQKDAAETLAKLAAVEDSNRALGREGALLAARDFVYKGELAQTIVSFYQAHGGLLTVADLAEYKVRIEPPVTVNYHGYDLYSCGPWCQGPVLPQALKILEGFDLKAMGHNSAEYVHAATQALNLAFADREQYIGDPAFVDVPIEEMMSEAYIGERRTLIDPNLAWPVTPPAGDPRRCRATLDGVPRSPSEAIPVPAIAGEEGGGTSYFGVIDGDGNIFSSTPSEGMKGGGPIIPGTGMYLSQRGSQSKLQVGHPASVAPGKRPRLTPAPALVLREGQPVMALGAHGGDHIPQGTLQIFLNVVEFGMDPQEAVEAARFYSYNFPSSGFPAANSPGEVRMEGRISQETVAELQRLGHKVVRYPDWWEGSALYGVITRNPETRVLQGGADPRCEAYGLGY